MKFSSKDFYILILLALFIFFIFASPNGAQYMENDASIFRSNSKVKMQDKRDIIRLEQEVKRVLKKTNQISPQTYDEIMSKIKKYEKKGLNTKNLRKLLSQFEIGGQDSKTSRKGSMDQSEKSLISGVSGGNLVLWDYNRDGFGWISTKKPPECQELTYPSPVDVSKATSILYPGQQRGLSINDYKAHGGFRFDNQYGQNIEVRSPTDGYIWRGNRHFVNGEIQYGFDIIQECGILHRFGHLYELSPEFQKLAEKLPKPTEMDSRTSILPPYVFVKKGDLMATKIGLPGNAGMDWGVYDLRKENSAAQDKNFRELHHFQRSYDFHALCWPDLLPEKEREIAKRLPGGDGRMGKTSDYCK